MFHLYNKNTPQTQKKLDSNPCTITRFLYQQLLTLSLNMLVQFSNEIFAFQARPDMDVHSVDIDPHVSQVTMSLSTKASVITASQVGHFTVVSNDFISTEEIFADFTTFSLITRHIQIAPPR